MSEPQKTSKGLFWTLLAVIVAAGVWFRFWDLGLSAFRADTILFWSLAQRDVSLYDVVTKWFEVSGAIGQMPLAGFFMKLFLAVTHLPVTPGNVRMPFALFGTLAIPMAYLAGRNLYDRRFGLLLAAFVGFNTYAVYVSREAYVYAPIIFGYFLYTAGLFDLRAQIVAGNRPRLKSLVFFGAGVVFSCYSQVTGAFIVATGALYLLWLIWRERKRFAPGRPPFLSVLVVHGAPVLPLLLVPWGYLPLLKQIFAAAGGSKQVVTLAGGNPFVDIPIMMSRMIWGTTPAAIALMALALTGIVYALVKQKDRRIGFLVFMVAFQIVVFIVTRSIAEATYEPRYISGAFPFLATLVLAGLTRLPDLVPALRGKPAAAVVAAAIGILFYCYPSYSVTQLTGKAVPYYEVTRWADANLPERAPVLMDRWFDPWNEMRAHPGTNAIFTFTVPNEPLENYIQLRWRDTATNFFAKFPDAAFVEIAKTYFDAPGVGPWTWPAEYFGHRHVITNQAGLVLRRWGVAPRGDFCAANSNRLVVTFYYNTREDLLAKFKQSGQPLHWLFAGGWGYANSGPHGACTLPLNMAFNQWRVLDESAKLELINLSPQPQQAVLSLHGVVIPRGNDKGAKTVSCSAGGASQTFPPGRMIEWKIPVTLPPGSTLVTLHDPLWASAPRPLYVERIAIGAP